MTVSEFINECNNFEYSKEYFDLYKEEQELNNLSVYMQSSYYTESSVENQKATSEKKEQKESGFFRKIYEKVVSLLKKFWNWIKSFFGFGEKSPAKQIQKDLECIQGDIEKLKELGKQYYEDPSMGYYEFFNRVFIKVGFIPPDERHTLLHNVRFENPALRRTLRNIKYYDDLKREVEEKGLPLWFMDVCENAFLISKNANEKHEWFFRIKKENIPSKYDKHHILSMEDLKRRILKDKGQFKMERFVLETDMISRDSILIKIEDKNSMEDTINAMDTIQQNMEDALKEGKFSHIKTEDLSVLTKYIHSTVMFYRDVYMELVKDMKLLKRMVRVGMMTFSQSRGSLRDKTASSNSKDMFGRTPEEVIEDKKKDRASFLKTYKDTFSKGE